MSQDIKQKLYAELEIKTGLLVDGINANKEIFKELNFNVYQEQVHSLSERDYETHVGIDFPVAFYSPHGLRLPFRWDRRSPYSVEFENGTFFLAHKGGELFPIEFAKRPAYYSRKTSDGTPAPHVASYAGEGVLFVAYSNECSLKEKGQDCLFCNINATKDIYGEAEGINWKYPQQIGETVAAALSSGEYGHITISGGFVPERRELEYYIDVAEAIKEHTGLADFNGTATIGVPADLRVIDKYKEAGYRTISMNIEIWDKNIFKAICPGKETDCGSWDHWVKALEYAVQVFGWGRVRSNIVAGIEPKKSAMEGFEYLASIGVVCFPRPWQPNPGSALEGHRSPEPEWHYDMNRKVAAIFRRTGFTYEQLYDCMSAPDTLVHDVYKIEDKLLPVFKQKTA